MRHRSYAPRLAALTVAFGLLCASQASAAIITYTDRTAFLAALSSSSQHDFQSLTSGAQSSPLGFSGNGFSFEVASSGNLYVVDIGGDRSVATNVNFVPLVVQNFGGGVTAFGADFFFNAGSAVSTTTAGTITASNGVDPNTVVSLSAPVPQSGFYGFISTGGNLTSVSFSNAGGAGFANIDDAIVGKAATAPVPEPATFALLALGLSGLGVLRRRA